MKKFSILLVLCLLLSAMRVSAQIVVGAARVEQYVSMLKKKRVALLSNHTGLVGDEHTLDVLLRNGIDVTLIFSPEHGFRGSADAGEHVKGSVDKKTGIPIVSLYGKRRTPTFDDLKSIDVVVSDMQDVGLRFYTYYITMLDVMNAAAKHGKKFVVFDRPNPLGMCVDGPILDMSLTSGVGRLPIPVVHGLTLGEMARMIVGEGWLNTKSKLDLTVIACEGYTHASRYQLPVSPSPNLKDMKAVYLYPSTCLFEGTVMSLGRGTDMPFCVYGHPAMKGCSFSFIPQSRSGATNPPMKGRKCYGRDLRNISDEDAIAQGVNLEYVIDAYQNVGMRKLPKFFISFFDKLIGNTKIRKMIEQGKSASQIKATWAGDVEKFKQLRNRYLIYPEE